MLICNHFTATSVDVTPSFPTPRKDISHGSRATINDEGEGACHYAERNTNTRISSWSSPLDLYCTSRNSLVNGLSCSDGNRFFSFLLSLSWICKCLYFACDCDREIAEDFLASASHPHKESSVDDVCKPLLWMGLHLFFYSPLLFFSFE